MHISVFGVKIFLGHSPVEMTGQIHFSSDIFHFWRVKDNKFYFPEVHKKYTVKYIVSSQGNLLASVKDENLHLWNFSSEKLNT